MTGIVTAISPWFGSKRNLAPRIVEELGQHHAYWEPFCGSLAVLMAKPSSRLESVNDLHGALINLARVLADEDLAKQLYGALSRQLVHEVTFREAAEMCRDIGRVPAPEKPNLSWAIAFMTSSWLGRNGVQGTESYNQGFCVRYTNNGGTQAKRWFSVIESIPEWHQRLRGVTILNRDAFELLERIYDATGTAIYVDPPYLVKGAKYVHDFQPADHDRLAELLHRFKKTRVVLSYYDDERLKELYPTWQRKQIEVTKSIVNDGMRDKTGATKVQEVLLINQQRGLF